MEESEKSMPHDACTKNEDAIQNSNPDSQRDVNDDCDESNFSHPIDQSSVHAHSDKTEVKLDHKESDVSSDKTEVKLDHKESDVSSNAHDTEMDNIPACSNEKASHKAEDASTSHMDDVNQQIDEKAGIPHKDSDKQYKCLQCDMTFRFKSLKNKHMLSHSDKRSYTCTICRKAFKRKDDLDRHKRTHKKENGEEGDCEKKKSRVKSSASKSHSVSSEKIKQGFLDNYYGKTNSKEESAENHEISESSSKSEVRNKRYPCSSCSMSFSFYSLLRNHIVIHSEERPFVCPVCSKTFKRKYDLIKHKKAHPELFESDKNEQMNMEDGIHVSETQTINSEEKLRLREMAEQISPDYSLCNGEVEDRPFKCSVCDLTFRLKSTLISHMVVHSEVRPYKCPICTKGFKRKDNLAEHRKTHEKRKKKKRGCKKTKTNDIRISSKFCHAKDKSPSNLTQTSNMKKVMKEKNACDPSISSVIEDRPFQCPSCDFSFRKKMHLTRHLLIHSGERPHVCTICKMGFKRKDYLMKHEKTHNDKDVETSRLLDTNQVHQEEDTKEKNACDPSTSSDVKDRPFQCPSCDFSFRKKMHLTRHSLIHSRERPHVCPICKMGFKRKDHLMKHEKTHNDKDVETSRLQDINQVHQEEDTKEKNACDPSTSSDVKDRPFQCPSCDFSFRKKMHLTRHSLIHSSERPHVCPICKMGFKRKDYLMKHEKTHNDKDVETSRLQDINQVHEEEDTKETNAKRDCLLGNSITGEPHKKERIVRGKRLRVTRSQKSVVTKGKDCMKHNIVNLEKETSNSHAGSHDIQSDSDRVQNNDTEIGQGEKSKLPECSNGQKSLTNDYDIEDDRVLDKECLDGKNTEMLFEQSGEDLKGTSKRVSPEESKTCEDDQLCEYSDCSVVFSQDVHVGTFQQPHGLSKWHVCHICKKSYIRKADLNLHHKKVHKSQNKNNPEHHRDERPHKCSICFMAFRMKGNLKTHMLKHSDDKPFECNVCKKGFKRKYDLDKHSEIHSRNKKHTCKLCGRVFKSKLWLEKHMKYHESENSLQCSVCNEKCQNKGQFIAHVKGHKKNASTVCPLCGKRFAVGTNLKQHLRRHKGEKPFECSMCDRSFVSKGEMMRHINMHTREKTYVCDMCGKGFTLLSSLRTHSRIHSGVKPFKCTICPKTFNQSHHLKTHLRSHLGDKPYKCPACDRAFSDRRTLRNHMVQHPNHTMPVTAIEKVERGLGQQLELESLQGLTKRLAKDRLGREQEELEDIEEGSEIVHFRHMPEFSNTAVVTTNSYVISREFEGPDMASDDVEMDEIMISEGWETCKSEKNYQGDEESSLQDPNRTEEDPSTYSDSKELYNCNTYQIVAQVQPKTENETNLETCLKNENSNGEPDRNIDDKGLLRLSDKSVEVFQREEKPCICSSCDLSFRNKEELETHLLTHVSASEEPFSCKVCKKTFERKDEWQKHTETHSRKYKHNCTLCGKAFRGKRWLDDHMKYHGNENSLQCAVCNKTCENNKVFWNHIKFHKRVSPKECTFCGKGFTSGNNLKQHLRRHKGEKPYKCTICSKSFVSKGEMMRHVNSHTREKSYMCDVCGNGFTLLSSLRTHSRIHSGEKPYKCTYCPKSFVQGHHLKTHLRSHFGDKPHKCTVCDRSFSDRRTLRNHLLRHEVISSANSISNSNNNAGQSQERILHTSHGSLLNLDFSHSYCGSY